MEAMTEPLARVVRAMQRFMRHRDIRLVHFVTTEPLRLAVLEHIAAAEHHGGNRCPFVILEAPVEIGNDGWAIRTEELREDLQELRARIGQYAVPALGLPGPDDSGGNHAEPSFVRFALDLRAAVDWLPASLEGLVVVLAPLLLRNPLQWAEQVRALVTRPELARVRWVIVEIEQAALGLMIRTLGGLVEAVDARVDERRACAALDPVLFRMDSASGSATGALRCGGPGPRVEAPPRKNKLVIKRSWTAATENESPAVTAPPALLQQIGASVLRASKAMREGRAPDAVRLQREARDTAVRAGLPCEAVVMALVLSGYALQGGAPCTALELLQDARRCAEQAHLHALAGQAQLGIGTVRLVQRRTADAALAYVEAAQLASAGGSAVLAIEAYRMAGQMFAVEGQSEGAAAAWWRAIDLARGAAPAERSASTAPHAARALAALCCKHGLVQQATALETQARQLESAETAQATKASLATGDGAVAAAPCGQIL